jgi:hypothetical protein
MGLKRLKPVISQVDTMVISHRGWQYLKQNLASRQLSVIRDMTDSGIIVKQSKTKYRVSVLDEKDMIFESEHVSKEITDDFMLGLTIKIAEGSDILKSVEYAVGLENESLIT